MSISTQAKAIQRQIILDRLQQSPITTLEAREIGIMSPASRIMELKRQGHLITSRIVAVELPDGRFTSCALYSLEAN